MRCWSANASSWGDARAVGTYGRGVSFLRDHRLAYIRSGGTQGHILDMRSMGGRFLATHCLIRYIGRKSGKTRITPLFYGDIAGEVAVVASLAGADHHPRWYLNIVESARVDVQIATQAYRAIWREAVGAEREKIWAFMVDCLPAYADYQRRTERRFPVVLMNPIEEIAVFSEADLG